jgi:thymidine phosphorylase
MHVPGLIEKKRDGGELSKDEVSYLIANFTRGGGRQTANDAIDFAVGISDLKKIGEAVEFDDILMPVHAWAEKSCNEPCRC